MKKHIPINSIKKKEIIIGIMFIFSLNYSLILLISIKMMKIISG